MIEPGDKVQHTKYGEGTVLHIWPEKDIIHVHYGPRGNHYCKISKVTKL